MYKNLQVSVKICISNPLFFPVICILIIASGHYYNLTVEKYCSEKLNNLSGKHSKIQFEAGERIQLEPEVATNSHRGNNCEGGRRKGRGGGRKTGKKEGRWEIQSSADNKIYDFLTS